MILAQTSGSVFPHGPQGFANEVFGLVTDAYLSAHPDRGRRTAWANPPEQIVRKAEDRFVVAAAGAISLADLCTAAGASKSSLYMAFHTVCGEPPLAYFRKRRLMQARSILLNAAIDRSAVKRTALAVGFTELGRFSVEYRRFFGESPSVTLNKSLD